ncbi:Uncharacterized conserved protein, DUF4415 family [Falsiroseomonas stagni DSM 19981]|uniref:Uncharacterized conserved protein, DUF4415 family n=2 Tax=Falsiroseomonas TaxID=2870713 RepID=A0A1I3ZFM1_9PROT|nr:Uncharacterized conserved protein, DUF4415 family [Falsiroseomonas stagni DSM 19981]
MKKSGSSRLDERHRESDVRMKLDGSEPLTREAEARLRALAAMPDETIDTSDIPEVLDWSDAVRGGMYRPVKRQITLRLDADLLDFFEAAGKGYQTRINAALREWVGTQRERKAG